MGSLVVLWYMLGHLPPAHVEDLLFRQAHSVGVGDCLDPLWAAASDFQREPAWYILMWQKADRQKDQAPPVQASL